MKDKEKIRVFGQRLKALRHESQLSVRALAAKAGVSFAVLTCVENAKRGAGRSTLERLGRALGLREAAFAEFVMEGLVIGRRQLLLKEAEDYPPSVLNAFPMMLRQLGIGPKQVLSVQLPPPGDGADFVLELSGGKRLRVSFKELKV